MIFVIIQFLNSPPEDAGTFAAVTTKKSGTGIYHIMQRGSDRRIIFSDDEDRIKFLNILKDVKEKSEFRLYAYCLMVNHLQFTPERRKRAIRVDL